MSMRDDDIGPVPPDTDLLVKQVDQFIDDLLRESDVLRGKRRLTREHIERLGKRFGVSPATFYSNANA